jgi:hypothetical protein
MSGKPLFLKSFLLYQNTRAVSRGWENVGITGHKNPIYINKKIDKQKNVLYHYNKKNALFLSKIGINA